MIERLQKDWRNNLLSLIKGAKNEIFISSPYVTFSGVEFIKNSISESFLESGKLTFLTNLSPNNIIQGSNNPEVFHSLSSVTNDFSLWHLPKLHAKVYISDKVNSIVTSGNLTNGGLFNNFEYGVQISNGSESQSIYKDINEYCQLGSRIDSSTLDSLISVSKSIVRTVTEKNDFVKSDLKELLQSVENELIKDRLNVGAVHNIFSKTILYILEKNQGLPTEQIHIQVQQIHPDLCNDGIDRIIEGKNFGKKWKHAVRTSQQHLKKKGLIYLENDLWKLVR